MSSILKYAFFARGIAFNEDAGGHDLTGAFMTGLGSRSFPARTPFFVIGEYHFDEAERATEHTFDVRLNAPADAASVQTAPHVYAPFETVPLPDGGSDVIFHVHVVITAEVPGTYGVQLMLDGERIFELPILIAQTEQAPDDLSGLGN